MPLLRSAVVSILLAACALGTPALAQDAEPDCSQLSEAQQRYDTGRFEEAIRIATGCLESGTGTEPQRQRAYRLIGLSYIGQDLRDDARAAVRQLVEMVPNFEPDPINDPPLFIEMVEEAQAAMAPEDMVAEEETTTEGEQVAEDVPIVDPARGAEADRAAEDARREAEAQRAAARRDEGGGGIGKWLLIGGAVVGGGVLAAVLLGGGDGGGGGGGGGIPMPPLPPGQ